MSKTDMTIYELMRKENKLRQDIFELIWNFEHETNAVVFGVEVCRDSIRYVSGTAESILTDVNINSRLKRITL